MNATQPTQMQKILSTCITLTIQACKIVKQCYKNSQIKTFMKDLNDPVTEADYKIQTMFMKGLNIICPNLRIVGEEEVEYKGAIDFNYKGLGEFGLPQEQGEKGEGKGKGKEGKRFGGKQKYQMEDLCVWIDPIDNTKGFISGEIQAVTVLVGISYKGVAEFGIIGHPFVKTGQEAHYEPTVYLGCVSEKTAYVLVPKTQNWERIPRPAPRIPPIITISPSRKNIIQTLIINQVKGQKLLAGGSGYKILLVIKGQADLLAYCDSFTKKWDSAAGEAIVLALGGYFITSMGQPNNYVVEANNYTNSEGILCGFDLELKNVSMAICSQQIKPSI